MTRASLRLRLRANLWGVRRCAIAVLAVLFVVRATMPFQFQSVAAFDTVYYAVMMLGPVVGGAYAKWTSNAAAAFDFGAAVILACPLVLLGFNRIPQPMPKLA